MRVLLAVMLKLQWVLCMNHHFQNRLRSAAHWNVLLCVLRWRISSSSTFYYRSQIFSLLHFLLTSLMKSPMKEFLWCVCIHKQHVLTCRPQTAWTSLPVIRSQSLINTWQLCAFPRGLINENFKADYILQTWCPDAHVFLSGSALEKPLHNFL